jgi:N utilization substance protein B
MSRRTRAREVALQILYQDDLNPTRNLAADEQFLRRRLLEDRDSIDFASSLISGVRRNRAELDDLLRRRADNWSLERMAATDRNLMRLSAFEILYTETPGRVVINEAVEIAKRFGSKTSPQFVNGVLDRVLKERKDLSGADAPTSSLE